MCGDGPLRSYTSGGAKGRRKVMDDIDDELCVVNSLFPPHCAAILLRPLRFRPQTVNGNRFGSGHCAARPSLEPF
jgi:hypothetical protein